MKYKAAVIGCGRIGCGFDDDPKRKHVATHAGAYSKNEDVKLVALVDMDKEKLLKYGEKFNVKGLYSDYLEMLEKEKPDIVSICTWNDTHYEITKNLVAHGVKGIFCEKPIAGTLHDANEMIALCEKNKAVLLIDHQRRFDEMHQEIKKYIDDGSLGRIQQASFLYTAGIANTGSHIFDLLRFFFGDAEWVYAVESANKSPNEKDPNLDGLIKFKSGAVCALQALDVKEYMVFELDVLGTRGRMRVAYSGSEIDYYQIEESKMYSGYKEPYKIDSPIRTDRPKNFMVNAVKHLVDCMKNRSQPISSGYDGKKSLELIIAFRESAQRGGEKIMLPLKDSKTEIVSR